jgi:hypothetical protein
MGISGIRRSSNAEEGAKRFFQTTNLIISHFKRDADKKLVNQLSSERNSLSNLLIASSAVHCYHYLGIRTKSSSVVISDIDSASKLEMIEQKELYNEISKLIGQTLQYELDLSKVSLNYEQQILEAMISGAYIKDENFLYNLKDFMEMQLTTALNKYPMIFFLDHVGELTGYSHYVKSEILKETAGLKSTTIDLEKDLVKDVSEDKYIELATANRLIEKMKEDFEFTSIKDLKLETFPIRKMINQIISYRLNLYPISMRGLESFNKATKLKNQIYTELVNSNTGKIDYNEMETLILDLIRNGLNEIVKDGPNEFVYFLENLLEMTFSNVYEILARYGISDVSLFCKIQNFDINKFRKDMQLNSISKMTLVKLSSKESDFHKVEEQLNEMKRKNLCVTESSVEEILINQKGHEIGYVKEACEACNIDFKDLQELFGKKQIIELVLKKKYNFERYSGFIMLHELSEIYEQLCRFIYFHFFSKICRQIARILETYVKSKEDKGLILLGLRRIFSANENEKWIEVKIEELILERIMNRQRELATIFDAKNQSFLVNSFIFARLMDLSIDSSNSILKNDPSPFYEEFIDLNLPQDFISPVSYVFAFDIFRRFKESQELLILQREQFQESVEEKSEQQRVQVKEIQELNTLNWIEKKITSAIMTVGRRDNPTSLYWSEKDQKITIDNIKMHSELENRLICPDCGFDCTDKACPDHQEEKRTALPIDLFSQYYLFALSRIKELWKKIKIPDYEEIFSEVHDWLNDAMKTRLRKDIAIEDTKNIIEGERREVAKEIATSIGGYLDKAIYKKFKAGLKAKNGSA